MGQLHREDGPAVEWGDGGQEWYLNGARHRENGPAVDNADGSYSWYLNGDKHRIDGPAVEAASGAKQWWYEGQLHRDGEPAIEGADGTREWYHYGKNIPMKKPTPQVFNKNKITEMRSIYDRPIVIVENRILAMRKKYIDDSDTSQGTKMKPKF
jgi:hypothetical protein